MERSLTLLGAAAVVAALGFGSVASAAPLIAGHTLGAAGAAIVQAQYIERRGPDFGIERGPRGDRGFREDRGFRVERGRRDDRGFRRGRVYEERRVVRPRRQVCQVEVVRRMTPQGMVVQRIRRCR